jgi:hypothetical protein
MIVDHEEWMKWAREKAPPGQLPARLSHKQQLPVFRQSKRGRNQCPERCPESDE